MSLPFIKMHGAGNDFVIFDARQNPLHLTARQVQAISARDNAVTKGCDQVIVMETPKDSGFRIQDSGKKISSPNPESRILTPDIFMRIYNADGSEVDACGNATRCVGWLLIREKNARQVSIQTKADILWCQSDDGDLVTVDMGAPKTHWRDIPLSREMDTLHTGIRVSDTLYDPVAVSMGNPHAVFFVSDARLLQTTDMEKVSHALQPFYPEGVNVSVAYVKKNNMNAPAVIDVRVWERGVGETLACGTAACAVMVAAGRREPFSDKAEIRFQPHGHGLQVALRGDGHVLLSGPVEMEFEGIIDV